MKKFTECNVPPQQSLEHKQTLTFGLDYANNSYINPHSIRLNGEYQVQKSVDFGNNWSALTADDLYDVSLINYPVQSMIRSCEILMSGTVVAPLSCANYAEKAFFENIISTNEQSACYHQITAGFIPDCQPFEQIQFGRSMNDVLDRGGNQTRSEWICSGPVGFDIPLHSDFCKVDKLWLDLLPIEVKLTMHDDRYVLLTKPPAADDPPVNYRIRINRMHLRMRRIQLYNDWKIDIDSRLGGGFLARYYTTCSVVRHFTVHEGVTSFEWNNAEHGKLPFQIILAFGRQSAVSGHLHQNPHELKHFNCEELYYLVNDTEHPAGRYKPAVSEANWKALSTYGQVVDHLNSARVNSSNMVTFDRWATGQYFILPLDLTPDSCAGFHMHPDMRGSIHIKGKFARPLTENITVKLYSSFNEFIEFDQERKVHCESESVLVTG